MSYSISGYGSLFPQVAPDVPGPDSGLSPEEEQRQKEIEAVADRCMNIAHGSFNYTTNECVCQFGVNPATGTCYRYGEPGAGSGSGSGSGGSSGGGVATKVDIPEILVSEEDLKKQSTRWATLAILAIGGAAVAYLMIGGQAADKYILGPEDFE